MTRRRSQLGLALAAALALTALLAGCIEITNPQFDARYTGGKRTYAVFAVHVTSPWARNPPVFSPVKELIVVDVARPSSAVTVPLAHPTAVSDVQIADGRPRVLLAEDKDIAEVDLLTRRISRVATPPAGPLVMNVRALGAAYAKDGALVSWFETSPGMGLTVTRRIGSREQSASVSLLDVFQRVAPFSQWRAQWTPDGLMFLAADEHYAYLVNSSRLPYSVGVMGQTTVWRADFSNGRIEQLGEAHTWPRALSPASLTHADRAMQRWGIPAEGPGGAVDFLSLTGGIRAAVSNLPTSNAGTVVFQPGGERYLELRPEWLSASGIDTVTVLGGSLGTTPSPLMHRKVRGVFGLAVGALGSIGDYVSYSTLVSTPGPGDSAAWGPAPLNRPRGSEPPGVIVLHLHNTRTGRDSTVATVTVDGIPSIDFVGSYTR